MKYSYAIACIIVLIAITSCRFLTCHGFKGDKYIKDGKKCGVTKSYFRNNWWNYYERGLSFADCGFFEEAKADLKEAINIFDRDIWRTETYGDWYISYFPHRELGLIYYKEGDLDNAIRELRTSLDFEQSDKGEQYLDKALKKRIKEKDTKGPKIYIEPVNKVSKAKFIKIKGSVFDNYYVQRILLVHNNCVIPKEQHISRIKKQPRETINFSFTVPSESGLNTMTVIAYDLTGNETKKEISFESDRQGPYILCYAFIRENADINSNKQIVKIKGSVQDASGLKKIIINKKSHVSLNGEENYNISKEIEIDNQQKEILIQATDIVDNKTISIITPVLEKDIHESLIEKDNTKPEIRCSEMENELINLKGVENNKVIVLTGKKTFSDQTVISLNAWDDRYLKSFFINEKNHLSKPVRTISFSQILDLSDGINEYKLRATDTSNNQSYEYLYKKEKKEYKVKNRNERLCLGIEDSPIKDESDNNYSIFASLLYGLISKDKTKRFQAYLNYESITNKSKLADYIVTWYIIERKLIENQSKITFEAYLMLSDNSRKIYYTAINAFDDKSIEKLCDKIFVKLKYKFPLFEGIVKNVRDNDITVELTNIEEGTFIKEGMTKFYIYNKNEIINDSQEPLKIDKRIKDNMFSAKNPYTNIKQGYSVYAK